MQRRKVSLEMKPRGMGIRRGKPSSLLRDTWMWLHICKLKHPEGPGVLSQVTLIQQFAWHMIKGLLFLKEVIEACLQGPSGWGRSQCAVLGENHNLL